METLNKERVKYQYMIHFKWLADHRPTWIKTPPFYTEQEAINWLIHEHMAPAIVSDIEVTGKSEFKLPVAQKS